VIEKRDCTEEKFIKCCELYLQKEGKAASRVKCNKRAICAALSDKSDEIKAFIEGNNLRMKTQEDLVAVVEYYNTLK
jgi:hypothetical protein